MNDLLNIQNLSKHYDGFDLSDISFSVPAGSVVGFIGANGAGKTTTIKAALGIIQPSSGSISLFGHPSKTMSSSSDASIKQRIGIVLDAVSFPDNISVADAATIMKASYSNWDQALFDTYRQDFNLDSKKKVKELSRGMGMKLSLACALSHHPDLLILDEATAGLDPMARDETLDILRAFIDDENHGILISSHITSDLEKIADYIVCIDDGRLVFSVEKDTIRDFAGVARCRDAEFQEIVVSGFFEPGEMHYFKEPYGTSVLILDRFAFEENFKGIALDKAGVDEYMKLLLKGATR